jgi:hypothetical protein
MGQADKKAEFDKQLEKLAEPIRLGTKARSARFQYAKPWFNCLLICSQKESSRTDKTRKNACFILERLWKLPHREEEGETIPGCLLVEARRMDADGRYDPCGEVMAFTLSLPGWKIDSDLKLDASKNGPIGAV